MNVGELRSKLVEFQNTLQVVVAADEEGNDFSPLSIVQLEYVDADGDVIHPDDITDDPDDLDKMYRGHLTLKVVLWP